MPQQSRKKTISKKRSKNTLFIYGGVIGFGLIVSIAAVVWGRSDAGVINVSEAIRSQNETGRATAEERGETYTPVPVRTNPDLKHGGLVPTNKENEPPPPAPPVDTASTTDESESADVETSEEESDDTDTSVTDGAAEEAPEASTEEAAQVDESAA